MNACARQPKRHATPALMPRQALKAAAEGGVPDAHAL
jgi:hypothetical protein